MNERREARASCSSLLLATPPLPSLCAPSFQLFPLPLPSPPIRRQRWPWLESPIGSRVPSSIYRIRYTKYRARTPIFLAFPRPCVDDTPTDWNEKDIFISLCWLLASLLMVRSSKDPSRNISPISLVRKGTGSRCCNVALVSSNRFVSDVFFVKYRLSPLSVLHDY